MSFRLRTRPVLAAAAIAALSVALAVPAEAAATKPADDPGTLTIVYSVKGETIIAASNARLPIKPTEITTTLNQDLTFSGTLPLRPSKIDYVASNGARVTAVVRLVEVGPATGRLIPKTDGFAVAASASYVVTLSNVAFNGARTATGPNCQTADPIVIPVQTPADSSFDLTNGGLITGTFPIGNLINCGPATALINSQVQGPGNIANLTLSNGRAS